jgi:hypothetical protein
MRVWGRVHGARAEVEGRRVELTHAHHESSVRTHPWRVDLSGGEHPRERDHLTGRSLHRDDHSAGLRRHPRDPQPVRREQLIANTLDALDGEQVGALEAQQRDVGREPLALELRLQAVATGGPTAPARRPRRATGCRHRAELRPRAPTPARPPRAGSPTGTAAPWASSSSPPRPLPCAKRGADAREADRTSATTGAAARGARSRCCPAGSPSWRPRRFVVAHLRARGVPARGPHAPRAVTRCGETPAAATARGLANRSPATPRTLSPSRSRSAPISTSGCFA